MIEKAAAQQVLGCLMLHPQFLSESDKYNLSINDFNSRFERLIFGAIMTVYGNGAQKINPSDIILSLQSNQSYLQFFEQNNGLTYLTDIVEFANIESFQYHYNKLKKFNLLRDLRKMGLNTSCYYSEDITDPNASKINQQFEDSNIDDIINDAKIKLLKLEHNYINNNETEIQNATFRIDDLLDNISNNIGIGAPLQGNIYNEIVGGARLGTLYIRSAGSGTGKTRQAVGDACFLAYPCHYNWAKNEWQHDKSPKKVMFIATEQNIEEIQKMILAYLSGINESKFRYASFTEAESRVLKAAIKLMKEYEDNFYIVRMPNPTIAGVKNLVRESVLIKDIKYVFYDYIFVGPALLQEFKGVNLRNDEALLMFSTALKDLAVELNICVMTSTQVNSNIDNVGGIHNESSISGSRAIINKADIGVMMTRPTNDELEILQPLAEKYLNGRIPNIVTDVYKVRSGAWTQVRIWSDVDLGTLRKEDLLLTDGRFNVLTNFQVYEKEILDWNEGEYERADLVIKELDDGIS